jgi:hypothetical protein
MTRREILFLLRRRGLAALAVVLLVVLVAPAPAGPGASGSPAPVAVVAPLSPAPTEAPPEPTPEASATPDVWALEAERCGAGRWAVKSLADAETGRIDLTSRVSAGVADLGAVSRPLVSLPKDRRIGPLETTLFEVTGRVIEARQTDHGEVQLVIADSDGSVSMIVAFPAGDCLTRTPAALRDRVRVATHDALAACGPLGDEWTALDGQARLIAPGYWASDDQAGPTSNGLWLSAPLSFEALGPCATSAAAQPPWSEPEADPL